jgi:hypothetical protein
MPTKEQLGNAIVDRTLVIPSSNDNQNELNNINIIKGLSTENDLTKIELRLKGFTYCFTSKNWIRIRKPIMNDYGIGNFMASLQALGDLANFSNYKETDIPKLVVLFFGDNYPTYILYATEFDLDPKDFNVINSILKFYSLSVLRNALNAGHRNVVRGTLSESVLQKAFGNNEEQPKKGGFWSGVFRKKGGTS